MVKSLALPFFGMMALTMGVWLYMYVCRLSYIFRQGISAQALSTPEQVNLLLPGSVNAPSNNLKNLFELPVLFYAACCYQFIQGEPNAIVLGCAYGFLFFRIIHSLIHCTVNWVILRFTIYVIATMNLFGMIIAEFLQFRLRV